MAFNACGFLTYCDEVLVTLGHRISAINDYSRVNNPPDECPSADSCLGSGDELDSPRTRRDSKNSAEVSDDEGQPPNAVAGTSREFNKTPPTPPQNDVNTNSPTAVFEYEDTRNDIALSEENVQDSYSPNGEKCCKRGNTERSPGNTYA